MKANQERVNQAVEMRRQGKTFSEISSVMGTNKSTLRKWFSSVVFTPEETCLIDQNILSRRTNRLKKTLTSDNKKIEGLAPTAKNYTKYLQAIEFRKNGCGLDDIANRLGVTKSTITPSFNASMVVSSVILVKKSHMVENREMFLNVLW